MYLPAVDKATVIQDPPAHLLVRDHVGRRLGFLGRPFAELSGAYLQSLTNRVIVLSHARDGKYSVIASARPRERFSLSAATVDFAANGSQTVVHEVTRSARMPASGRATVSFTIDAVPVRVKLDVRRSGRSGIARIRCSERCSVTLTSTLNGRTRAVWRGRVRKTVTRRIRYRRGVLITARARDAAGYVRSAEKATLLSPSTSGNCLPCRHSNRQLRCSASNGSRRSPCRGSNSAAWWRA